MIIAGILLINIAITAQAPRPPASSTPQQSACAQALADSVADGAAGEICAGDEAMRLAIALPGESAGKRRQWFTAAEHYRRAATLASKVPLKILALNMLVDSYDAQRLNDPKSQETALRELIFLVPDDLKPTFRLAKLLEDEGFIDAAEDTLIQARRLQPQTAEPNRALAQFYARRVTVLHLQEQQNEPKSASGPAERDENGIYRVGGPVTPPARLDVPRYPPEAQAAGIKGVVIAEVVVDPAGNVTDPKILRSIPFLDEAALQAVRNWRYTPTVINGQAVPVRMTVTVNFGLSSAAPSPAPPTPPAAPGR